MDDVTKWMLYICTLGEVRVIPTPIRVIATTLGFKGVYINSELWNVCVDTY